MTPAQPTLPLLLLRLDTCVWKVERDQGVTSEEYTRVLAEIRALGPALDDAERTRLADGVQRLVVALRDASGRLVQNLSQARVGRRAVRAYAEQAGGR